MLIRLPLLALALSCCLGLTACAGDEEFAANDDLGDGGAGDAGVVSANPDVRYLVGGTVDGLVGTVVLSLNGELLELDENGPFSFRHGLEDGDKYEVEVAEQPDDEWCTVENDEGVIDGEPISDLFVLCDPENPGIEDILLSSGQLEPEFSPATTRYRVDVPLWIEGIAVTPDAVDSDIEITVSGERYRDDPLWLELALGQNTIEIETLAENGDRRTYTLDIHRATRVVEEAYGKATIPAASSQMTHCMSLWGDRVAVGAPGHSSASSGINGDENDESSPSSGAVYVFVRTETGWKQEAFIKPESPGDGDLFGFSVALVADTLVVGAPQEGGGSPGRNGDQDSNDTPQSGAVYVFEHDGEHWEQVAYLKTDEPVTGDELGRSIALQRDGELAARRIVAGAYHDKSSSGGVNPPSRDEAAPNSGAAYIFEHRDGDWTQVARLKASNPDPGDQFGASVSVSDRAVVVGAPWEASAATSDDPDQDDNEAMFSGAVYVFEHDADNDAWSQTAYLKAHNAAEQVRFGNALSADGNTLAVGAFTEPSAATGIDPDQDDDSAPEAGAVYIFDRSEDGWEQTAYIKASNTGAGDRFGGAVALRHNALAIGASLESSAETGVSASTTPGAQANDDALGAGAVYVYYRVDSVWTQHAYLKASNAQPGDNFGYSLGFDGTRLAIGAPYEDSAIGGISEDGGGPNNVATSSGAIYWFR